MAEVRQFGDSVLRQEEARDHDSARLVSASASVATEFCAYNNTAQRFISNHVEVADLAADTLEHRLSKLTPNSGIAIWIIPIRELSPTNFRFPVNLLYLNENCSVLEVVHSFPIGRVSSLIAAAASVLALPAHAVLASGIETCDQLVVCSPAEMEHRFQQGYEPTVEKFIKPQLIRNRTLVPEPDQNAVVGRIPSFGDEVRGSGTWEEQRFESVSQICALAADPLDAPFKPEEKEISAEASLCSLRINKTEGKKKWWQRLFPDESDEDNRQARRLALPGLVAYFFTGAAPVAHKVRNISTSGLYVLTSESWYKGTVVRITLTDEREPTAERSITLHGMVVRCADDGVAFQFIVEKKDELRHCGFASTLEHLPAGASARQIAEFIVRFKSRS